MKLPTTHPATPPKSHRHPSKLTNAPQSPHHHPLSTLKTLLLAPTLLLALFPHPTSALTEDQSGYISQNCATIKQTLRTLEKSDSRTRAYLGTVYSNILNNFITPLNLRLVRIGHPDPSITNNHSELISAKDDFVHQFTAYSQSFEELINTDCQKDPEIFYQHLSTTRERRNSLEASTVKIRSILNQHLEAVKDLENSL